MSEQLVCSLAMRGLLWAVLRTNDSAENIEINIFFKHEFLVCTSLYPVNWYNTYDTVAQSTPIKLIV